MNQRTAPFFAQLLVASLLIGACSKSNTQAPSYSFFDDRASSSNDCCGVTYTDNISGVAPPGGAYYWSALILNDSVVLRGDPVWIASGSFSGVPLSISIAGTDRVPTGSYTKRLYMSPILATSRLEDSVQLQAEGGLSTLYAIQDSNCATCCTGYDPDPRGLRARRYCVGAKRIGSSVVGVKADIKTRWGLLCGSGVSDSEAQSNAFANIQNGDFTSVPVTAWAQCGYMRYRSKGAYDDTAFVYVEWQDSTGARETLPMLGQYNVATPTDGSVHTYEVARTSDGTGWKFYYDFFDLLQGMSGASPMWRTTQGIWAVWETEILRRETDMAGTAENPCTFANCLYKVYGSQYSGASFGSGDVVGCSGVAGNPKQWDCSASQNTFSAWDLNPLNH